MSHCAAAAPAGDSDADDVTAAAAAASTWRSDVSSNVTSLSLMTQRSADDGHSGQVLRTARQLIAELQAMLTDDSDAAGGDGADATEAGRAMMGRREKLPSSSSSASDRPPSQPILQPEDQQQQRQLHLQQRHDRHRLEPTPPSLELQACNGLCVVFANFASFLPTGEVVSDNKGADAGDDKEDSSDRGQRAGQIRDSAAAIGRLFNSRLEFTVLIHWNKSRRETLGLLRQAAAAMSEVGRDCCFAFFLGRGAAGHFVAACGGHVTLTDILATLAVGQRARLPVFVFGELTPTAATSEANQSTSARPSLPSNQLLLWTLGAPQVTDLLVDQLAGSHLSGGKDVASTVAAIAEWIRRRGGRGGGCGGCRFLSKLDRLVYLASPDCI